jgi:hypothetical protein
MKCSNIVTVSASDTSSVAATRLNGLDQKMKQISMDISGINTGLSECKLMLQTLGRGMDFSRFEAHAV